MHNSASRTSWTSIKGLSVRLIQPNEECEWDRLVSTHHYLGFRCLVGETLKYVAILNEEWVACIGWGAAALNNASRDHWIGWPTHLKLKRLKYLANNMRFLIFPWIQIKNLASKILAENLKRLSKDWEIKHGHPIVLAETFVDHQRFAGTCYLAAGWTKLGKTKGFRKNGKRYYFHGQSKTIFIKPLHQRTNELLRATFLSPEFNSKEGVMDMNTINIKELLQSLAAVTDKRKKRGIRHQSLSILGIAVCAVLSGCKSFIAIGEWAAQLDQETLNRFGCRYDAKRGAYQAPSEPTFRRMLQRMDGEILDKITGQWMAQHCKSQVISFDGKTLRGSGSENQKPIHLVAAVLQREGVVIGQSAVDEKSNEIKAAEPLLKDIDLAGKTVSADAMHTQVELAHYLKKTAHTMSLPSKGIKAIY